MSNCLDPDQVRCFPTILIKHMENIIKYNLTSDVGANYNYFEVI